MGIILLETTAGGKKILKLSGELTIEVSPQLKNAFLEAFESGHGLEVDMSEAEAFDLACVQVFCAAHRHFADNDQTLTIAGIVPEGVRSSLSDTAIDPSTCDSSCTSQCLWAKGGGHD